LVLGLKKPKIFFLKTPEIKILVHLLTQAKAIAKKFEGELAHRLGSALRTGDITPSRKVIVV
jgi:hypothetical protein